MLTRIYADNYKCFANLEFRPRQVQMIVGLNGVGKSSAIDLLGLLGAFVTGGGRTADLFSWRTLTRWQARNLQTFELEVEGDSGQYLYRLEVEHQINTRQNRVFEERLTFDGKPIFGFKRGTVQLYRDDFSVGPTFQFDRGQSALGVIGSRQDNQRLVWFRNWLQSLRVVRLHPYAMKAEAPGEDPSPLEDMSNFASWYRHLVLENPGVVTQLHVTLRELWDNFETLKLEKAGESIRVLKAAFRNAADNGSASALSEYALDELSDGQRALLVLYTLLNFARMTKGSLLCVDEPANYVALAEIQPWLAALVESAEDHGFQVFLASHHPEFINYLAPERAVLFTRLHGGPTRVTEFRTEEGSRLTPAEILARGWENG